MYTISKDHQSILRGGQAFFTSPIANQCESSLNVGMVIPPTHPHTWSNRTEVLVAGGNCCHGYLIGVNAGGKITVITSVDFNVYSMAPVINESKLIGVLVCGHGCSGSGVRFVSFDGAIPTVTTIPGTDHPNLFHEWARVSSPLVCPDIWNLLKQIGVTVDREQTRDALKDFTPFKASR